MDDKDCVIRGFEDAQSCDVSQPHLPNFDKGQSNHFQGKICSIEGKGKKRRYGDSIGIDWEDPFIAQLVEDYLSGKIRSLELLCWQILEHTGVTVSKMTLSRRLSGKSFYSTVKQDSHFSNALSKTIKSPVDKKVSVPERRSERISKNTYHLVSFVNCKRRRFSEVKSGSAESLGQELESRVKDVWSTPSIIALVNAFERGEVASLGELQAHITECVGLKVPLSVLTSKLKEFGIRTLKKKPGASQNTEVDMPSTSAAVTSDKTLISKSSEEVICGTAASEASFGGMSRCLNSTVLTIPLSNGMVRQYMQNKTGHEKENVKYFRCSHCATIHRRLRTDVLPKIKVVNDVIVGDRYPVHHALCRPISRADAIVREIDRNCRREIRLGLMSPKDAWNAGRWRAMQEAEKLRASSNGDLNDFDDVTAAFPTWKKVRSQYLRLGLLAKTDPKSHFIESEELTAGSDGDGEDDYSL